MFVIIILSKESSLYYIISILSPQNPKKNLSFKNIKYNII